MKYILKNPISLWLKWLLHLVKLKISNRHNNLKVGYMSFLHNVKLGNYNTFNSKNIIHNSTIDDFVYVANYTKIINSKIGKFCSIGSNVKIGLGIHPTEFVSTFPSFFSVRNQCQISFVNKNLYEELGSNIIGNDVWIGDNVLILSNIKIGDGAVIAAGAVVTKNVEPYSIVGGVPSKEIKKRFQKEQIKSLLDIKWWNKDLNWLKNNAFKFCDVDGLINDLNNRFS